MTRRECPSCGSTSDAHSITCSASVHIEQSSHLHDDERIPRTTRTTQQGMLADALEKSDWSNTSIGNKALILDAIAALRLSASPAGNGRREEIARIIDPTAKFEDILDVKWSRYEIQRRELAYSKADAILALTTAVAPDGAREASAGRRKRLSETVILIGKALEAGRALASIFPLDDDALPQAKDIIERRRALLNVARYEFETTFQHDLAALALPAVVGIEGREAIAALDNSIAEYNQKMSAAHNDPALSESGLNNIIRDCVSSKIALLKIRAALARHPHQPVEDWRDISTAPKDGRTIEVKYLTDDPRKVRWSQSAYGTTWHLVETHSAAILKFEPTHWRAHPLEPVTDAGE